MSITQIYFQCEKKNGQILFREKPLETTYLCPSTLATDRDTPNIGTECLKQRMLTTHCPDHHSFLTPGWVRGSPTLKMNLSSYQGEVW